MKDLIRGIFGISIFIFLLGAFLIIVWGPSKAQADDGHSFDVSNKMWKIDLQLVGENKDHRHNVDAIIVNPKEQNVVVLYPSESRGIKYADSQVGEIRIVNSIDNRVIYIKK